MAFDSQAVPLASAVPPVPATWQATIAAVPRDITFGANCGPSQKRPLSPVQSKFRQQNVQCETSPRPWRCGSPRRPCSAEIAATSLTNLPLEFVVAAKDVLAGGREVLEQWVREDAVQVALHRQGIHTNDILATAARAMQDDKAAWILAQNELSVERRYAWQLVGQVAWEANLCSIAKTAAEVRQQQHEREQEGLLEEQVEAGEEATTADIGAFRCSSSTICDSTHFPTDLTGTGRAEPAQESPEFENPPLCSEPPKRPWRPASAGEARLRAGQERAFQVREAKFQDRLHRWTQKEKAVAQVCETRQRELNKVREKIRQRNLLAEQKREKYMADMKRTEEELYQEMQKKLQSTTEQVQAVKSKKVDLVDFMRDAILERFAVLEENKKRLELEKEEKRKKKEEKALKAQVDADMRRQRQLSARRAGPPQLRAAREVARQQVARVERIREAEREALRNRLEEKREQAELAAVEKLSSYSTSPPSSRPASANRSRPTSATGCRVPLSAYAALTLPPLPHSSSRSVSLTLRGDEETSEPLTMAVTAPPGEPPLGRRPNRFTQRTGSGSSAGNSFSSAIPIGDSSGIVAADPPGLLCVPEPQVVPCPAFVACELQAFRAGAVASVPDIGTASIVAAEPVIVPPPSMPAHPEVSPSAEAAPWSRADDLYGSGPVSLAPTVPQARLAESIPGDVLHSGSAVLLHKAEPLDPTQTCVVAEAEAAAATQESAEPVADATASVAATTGASETAQRRFSAPPATNAPVLSQETTVPLTEDAGGTATVPLLPAVPDSQILDPCPCSQTPAASVALAPEVARQVSGRPPIEVTGSEAAATSESECTHANTSIPSVVLSPRPRIGMEAAGQVSVRPSLVATGSEAAATCESEATQAQVSIPSVVVSPQIGTGMEAARQVSGRPCIVATGAEPRATCESEYSVAQMSIPSVVVSPQIGTGMEASMQLSGRHSLVATGAEARATCESAYSVAQMSIPSVVVSPQIGTGLEASRQLSGRPCIVAAGSEAGATSESEYTQAQTSDPSVVDISLSLELAVKIEQEDLELHTTTPVEPNAALPSEADGNSEVANAGLRGPTLAVADASVSLDIARSSELGSACCADGLPPLKASLLLLEQGKLSHVEPMGPQTENDNAARADLAQSQQDVAWEESASLPRMQSQVAVPSESYPGRDQIEPSSLVLEVEAAVETSDGGAGESGLKSTASPEAGPSSPQELVPSLAGHAVPDDATAADFHEFVLSPSRRNTGLISEPCAKLAQDVAPKVPSDEPQIPQALQVSVDSGWPAVSHAEIEHVTLQAPREEAQVPQRSVACVNSGTTAAVHAEVLDVTPQVPPEVKSAAEGPPCPAVIPLASVGDQHDPSTSVAQPEVAQRARMVAEDRLAISRYVEARVKDVLLQLMSVASVRAPGSDECALGGLARGSATSTAKDVAIAGEDTVDPRVPRCSSTEMRRKNGVGESECIRQESMSSPCSRVSGTADEISSVAYTDGLGIFDVDGIVRSRQHTASDAHDAVGVDGEGVAELVRAGKANAFACGQPAAEACPVYVESHDRTTTSPACEWAEMSKAAHLTSEGAAELSRSCGVVDDQACTSAVQAFPGAGDMDSAGNHTSMELRPGIVYNDFGASAGAAAPLSVGSIPCASSQGMTRKGVRSLVDSIPGGGLCVAPPASSNSASSFTSCGAHGSHSKEAYSEFVAKEARGGLVGGKAGIFPPRGFRHAHEDSWVASVMAASSFTELIAWAAESEGPQCDADESSALRTDAAADANKAQFELQGPGKTPSLTDMVFHPKHRDSVSSERGVSWTRNAQSQGAREVRGADAWARRWTSR